MLHTLVHVLPGLVGLVIAAAVVLWLGSRDQKTTMIAVLVCWLAATAGQVLTGRMIAPIVGGDALFAIWLIWFAWKRPAWWIWTLFGVEGLRLMLHASQFGLQPWLPYARLNNTLSLAALAVLALAAVLHARQRGLVEVPAAAE